MEYTLSTTLQTSYDDTVAATRDALAAEGFGVLSEIDIKATLKKKLDVDVPAQVILGACRPQLAHAALQADPSLGVLLPCNVVVREVESGTLVQAVDPETMMTISDRPGLREVGRDAKERLQRVLGSLGGER